MFSRRKKNRTPSVKETMRIWEEHKRISGKSDEQMIRELLTAAIENGIDVFAQVPDGIRELAELQYPDIVQLSRKRFPIH